MVIFVNNKKKNIICILLLFITFCILYLLITKGKYLFASTTDFKTQHYLIPEYFRTLFYKTFDLFPDFAFNLSGGVNIYYLSYYGFLSPLFLISYFLPFVKMLDFTIVITCLVVIISVYLFYFYLRKIIIVI